MSDPNLRTQRDDDRLLDRLGRGERIGPRDGDDVEVMLSAWRSSLPEAGPPDAALLNAIARPQRPRRRMARASIGVAASVAVLSSGVMVAAASANPDSPLWPVTRLVYGNLADSRIALDDASRAIADARTAAAEHRYPDALRLLDAAGELAGRVDDPAAKLRLRDAIADVRGRLPADMQGPTERSRGSAPTESLGVETPPLDPGDEPDATPRTPRGGEPGPGAVPLPNPESGYGDEDSDEGEEEADEGAEPPDDEQGKPQKKVRKPHKAGTLLLPPATLVLPSVAAPPQ